jgi:hypothetical protein
MGVIKPESFFSLSEKMIAFCRKFNFRKCQPNYFSAKSREKITVSNISSDFLRLSALEKLLTLFYLLLIFIIMLAWVIHNVKFFAVEWSPTTKKYMLLSKQRIIYQDVQKKREIIFHILKLNLDNGNAP